jgi:hypothetical protein
MEAPAPVRFVDAMLTRASPAGLSLRVLPVKVISDPGERLGNVQDPLVSGPLP